DQRVIVHCQAGEIDSRLTPDVRVYTSDGRELTQGWLYSDADAVADFTPGGDGEYLIRVAQQAYQYGGNEYFYRLHVGTNTWVDAVFPPVAEPGKTITVTAYGRNLPAGKPAEGESIDGRPLEQ